MSLLQCVLTGSPGYGKAEPRKKVMSVCSALPPEPSLSWEEQVSLVFSRCVSVGSVWGKMDFLHVLSEYLHQRELIPLLGRWGGEGEGGAQWCLLMLPLRQSPMTNSPQTEEVTDAGKLSGWFWELVNPNCHQCWQGPCHTDTVSTPAGTESSLPSQTIPVISAHIS